MISSSNRGSTKAFISSLTSSIHLFSYTNRKDDRPRKAQGKIVSPPCDSSIIGAVPGGVPGTITSSSSLSSTNLDTVGLDTPWAVAKTSLSEGGKSQAFVKGLYRIFY